MAEFEHLEEFAGMRFLQDGRTLPVDFDDDDETLAAQLNDLFNLEREELPPLYAQTLLYQGCDEAEFELASDDFEDRIAERVFQRLEMPRPLPVKRKPQPARLGFTTSARHAGIAVMIVCVLVAFNAMTSGAALASMIRFIVGRGGAEVVAAYPNHVSTPVAPTTNKMADHMIRINVWWPGNTKSDYLVQQGYSFKGMDVYDSQWWSNGALVTLRYVKTDAQGIHRLTVLEFMPTAHDALQVVQNGSISAVPGDGANGIFVVGRWVMSNGITSWSADQRAELISGVQGEPGLVVWIAADDVTPTNMNDMKSMLSNVAETLRPLHYGDLGDTADNIHYQGSDLSATGPFGNDVIALIPADQGSNTAAIFIRLGTDGADPPPTVSANSGPAHH